MKKNQYEKQILESLKENFPIQEDESLRLILAFIHDRINICQLNLKYLEASLLLSTRKVKLQLEIKDFFASLKKRPDKKNNTIKVSTGRQTNAESNRRRKKKNGKGNNYHSSKKGRSKQRQSTTIRLIEKAKKRKAAGIVSFASKYYVEEPPLLKGMIQAMNENKKRDEEALSKCIKIPRIIITENEEDVLHQ